MLLSGDIHTSNLPPKILTFNNLTPLKCLFKSGQNEVFKTVPTGSPSCAFSNSFYLARSRSSRARFFDRPHWPRAWNRLNLYCLLVTLTMTLVSGVTTCSSSGLDTTELWAPFRGFVVSSSCPLHFSHTSTTPSTSYVQLLINFQNLWSFICTYCMCIHFLFMSGILHSTKKSGLNFQQFQVSQGVTNNFKYHKV